VNVSKDAARISRHNELTDRNYSIIPLLPKRAYAISADNSPQLRSETYRNESSLGPSYEAGFGSSEGVHDFGDLSHRSYGEHNLRAITVISKKVALKLKFNSSLQSAIL
jgi:hypothetical protein